MAYFIFYTTKIPSMIMPHNTCFCKETISIKRVLASKISISKENLIFKLYGNKNVCVCGTYLQTADQMYRYYHVILFRTQPQKWRLRNLKRIILTESRRGSSLTQDTCGTFFSPPKRHKLCVLAHARSAIKTLHI